MPTARKFLVWISLLLVTTLLRSWAIATETSLFDIELQSDYRKTAEIMRTVFKYPETSGMAPEPFTTFTISPKGHTLTIFSDEKNKVSKIRIAGDTPLDKLNFIGSINLGTSASNLEVQAGLPAVAQAKSDGSRFYIFGNSNFAVETRSGKVSSISIYITNSNQIKSDLIKNYCFVRHPIWQQGDFFYTEIGVEMKGKVQTVVAQINTGSKKTIMSPNLCRKFNCKAAEPQLATLKLGQDSSFQKKEYLLIDSPKILGRSFDISLGSDFLFAYPMLLNLQHDYICKPRIPLDQIAKSLQMAKLLVKKDDDAYLIPIRLLTVKQTLVRFDSGNRDMALDKKSIHYLKGEKLPLLYFPGGGKSLGTYSSKLKFLIGNSTSEAERFFVSPLSRYQKIGAKQMTGIVWGFDLRNKSIYIKK